MPVGILDPVDVNCDCRRRRLAKPLGWRQDGPVSAALNNRAQVLLKALIGRYIKDGQPVGSKLLAGRGGLDLSPATIRNVMAELERYGYLSAPHTSAGRVPTTQGYRFFVDTMLTAQPVPQLQREEIRLTLSEQPASRDAVSTASSLLSELTSFVGVVTTPRRESFVFRHIDFVAMNGEQVLVILVFDDGEVQNRVIATHRPLSPAELEQAANFLNREFAGRLLGDIKHSLVSDMANARKEMDRLMQAAIDMAQSAFSDAPDKDVVVSGQTNLMACQDLANVEKLKALLDTIQQKSDLMRLLDECVQAEGVRLFIGEESGHQALGDVSLVSAPYTIDGEVVGVLGVIGPTRMAYDRVISVVETTARALGKALDPVE